MSQNLQYKRILKNKIRYEENATKSQTSGYNVFRGFNVKFSSFLVWILIQKDDTDNKVLEKNFIQKKQERKDGKNKALQILV